jgi:hypothetical protein
MPDKQIMNEKRYISLKDGSVRMSGRRGFTAAPHSRLVQISKTIPPRYAKRPEGVLLHGNITKKRLADRGLAQIFEILIYGLGLLIASFGIYNILGKRNGEQYG